MIENTEEKENTIQIFPETITTIALLIITFLRTLKPQLKKLLKIGKRTKQVVLVIMRTISHNKYPKETTKTYRITTQVITGTTKMTSCNSLPNHQETTNRNQDHRDNWTAKQKLYDNFDRLYQPYYTPTPEKSDNQ